MCGRYKISTKAPEIIAAFHVEEIAGIPDAAGAAVPYQPAARYNVAPTDAVPVVKVGPDGKRMLAPHQWGLIPFWAQDRSIGVRMLNARIETLFQKPAFRDSLKHRRCLIVADGFYEWKRTGEGKKADKQPHLFCFEDRHVFAFAGLWASWRPKGVPDVDVLSCSIVTMPPNALASSIHDRMPLIFDPARDDERIAAWLDPKLETVDLAELSVPRDLPGFACFPVDKRVGNVRNDDAALAEPLPLPAPAPASPQASATSAKATQGTLF